MSTHSVPSRVWAFSDADEECTRAIAAGTGLSPVVARILAARGVRSAAEAQAFLSPSLDRDWRDPELLPGMPAAADAVADAVRGGRRIVVFGDFDVDGLSAAATAGLGLRALGADVTPIVPHRFREGYGLTLASVERLLALEPDLVLTVDCGIAAADEVAALCSAGVDVVVTDHHEAGELVPVGVPVCDPKLGAYPFPELAGAGVALKLVQGVGTRLGMPDAWRELIDLAALGTVADIVPLLDENRALVAEGIARLRSHPRPGPAALAAVAGVDAAALEAAGIAYALAPRLNAAGRMADPALALELLVTADVARAEELAHVLDEHNKLRQTVEKDLSEEALALAERTFTPGDRMLVLAGEGWHDGVKGIVASRVAQAYGIPALLFSVEEGMARGSGRSVPGVDLHAALCASGDLLERFGGHAAAVGVVISAERLPLLAERLAAHMAALPAEAFVAERHVDAEVPLEAVGYDLIAELALLEPFGHSNPKPLLASRGVFMGDRKRVGAGANHLRFTAFDGTASLASIAFRCPEIETLADRDAAVDLAYEVEADEWRGKRRIQLLVRDVLAHDAPSDAPAAELVEDLFARAEEIVAGGEYAGIADADAFHTKLAGVTFEGRQDAVVDLAAGTALRLARQPDNPYDANACALFDPHGVQVGFFNRRLASAIAPAIDAGSLYDVEVSEVTGGDDGRSRGVNVLVSRRTLDADVEAGECAAARRAELAALTAAERDAALARHFLGDRRLHDAQRETLEHLSAGESCLTVMATGRGKSLIFHLHAAREAIARGRASVFVYPLRALVADQAFHLEGALAEIGVACRAVTGESSLGARDQAFRDLADGALDVVMTTPEFLERNADRFGVGGRVGFVVVDEAHHVGMSGATRRPAYQRLEGALHTLGDPTVLAVTATAGDEVAGVIRSVLAIPRTVLDPTVRDNLCVQDRRSSAEKVAYVSSLASRGEKVIVYVNSREQSVRIAQQLRKASPGLLHRVAFYNGGLARPARHAVERAFRDGELTAVVATSAFGEGVNIPDVRHVVLFHLPFNDVEFNQMSGRAGRDGAPASVHLLYGPRDARLNEMILESLAPQRDDLAQLYLVLRDLMVSSAEDGFEITNAELAERVKSRRPKTKLSDKGVSAGLGVFRDLRFVEGEGTGAYRRLRMLPAPGGKLDLTSSVRYAEGLEECATFAAFKQWALESPPAELLYRFNKPILPTA
jgi:single-stranded-DNA-specific exonuclease